MDELKRKYDARSTQDLINRIQETGKSPDRREKVQARLDAIEAMNHIRNTIIKDELIEDIIYTLPKFNRKDIVKIHSFIVQLKSEKDYFLEQKPSPKRY